MLCCDTSCGRHSVRLACLRSHVLCAYSNFELKQANSIAVFGWRPNKNLQDTFSHNLGKNSNINVILK